MEGYWDLSCQSGKGGVQTCSIIWSGSVELGACRVDKKSMMIVIFPVHEYGDISHILTSALQVCKWSAVGLNSWSTVPEGHQELTI